MSKKEKILICDDEEGIRESFKLILGEKYDLIFACNGQECFETLNKQGQDIGVVLMDIKMPKQNGLEITKDVKRRYPHLKVIVVTGYASAEVAQEALACGANDYIPKPFESKDVLNKVKMILG